MRTLQVALGARQPVVNDPAVTQGAQSLEGSVANPRQNANLGPVFTSPRAGLPARQDPPALSIANEREGASPEREAEAGAPDAALVYYRRDYHRVG